jgi:acetyl-CoA acyltransferase
MRSVLISGVGMTAFGKFLDRGLRSLSEEAVRLCLQDAGIGAQDIEQVYFANAAAGVVTGQEMIRAQAALRDTGLAGLPMFNIENACASGSSALQLAWLSVASGQADSVLVVGAEKLSHEDKQISFGAFAKGVDLEEPKKPEIGQGSGSIFMDIYAAKTRRWMSQTGATSEDLAMVCVKSRLAASFNPLAQFRQTTTIAEVLASRTVSAPLTLPMCSGIGDGAAALHLCSESFARIQSLNSKAFPPVFVRSIAVVSASNTQDKPICALRASQKAYEQAGLGPKDIDVAELHDATAPAELMHYENLGFCELGEAGELIRSGATGLNGKISVNPSGGLLSRGHPVGATGVAQIVELSLQLRGQAGHRQRHGARVALAENNGGQIAGDAAVAVVSILSV